MNDVELELYKLPPKIKDAPAPKSMEEPSPEPGYIDFVGKRWELESDKDISNQWLIDHEYADPTGRILKNYWAEVACKQPPIDNPLSTEDIQRIAEAKAEKAEVEFERAFKDSQLELEREAAFNLRFSPIFEQALAECRRQEEKWGDQIGHTDGEWLMIFNEELGEACTELNDVNDGKGSASSWYRFETEMIQSIAVLCSWLEAYRRRRRQI